MLYFQSFRATPYHKNVCQVQKAIVQVSSFIFTSLATKIIYRSLCEHDISWRFYIADSQNQLESSLWSVYSQWGEGWGNICKLTCCFAEWAGNKCLLRFANFCTSAHIKFFTLKENFLSYKYIFHPGPCSNIFV